MPNTNYVSRHTGAEIDEAVDKVLDGTAKVYNVIMSFSSYLNETTQETIERSYNIEITLFSNNDISLTKDNIMSYLLDAQNIEIMHRNNLFAIISGHFLRASSGTILTYGYVSNVGKGTFSSLSMVTNPADATHFNVVKVG